MGDSGWRDWLDTVLIFKLCATVVLPLVFISLRWTVRRAITQYAKTRAFSASRIASAHRAVSVIGFLVLFGALAVVWSINFQSLMVASGAILATIGIGFFAGWSILSNVTTSIIMFWRFPMHVGDRIGLTDDKNFVAVVKEFTPFYMILEDLDGNIVTLPNTLTLQQMFIIYRGENPQKEETNSRGLNPQQDPNSDAD